MLTFFLEKLSDIEYVDYPELKFNKHESTEMPFRYVVEPGTKNPIMPKVGSMSNTNYHCY